MWPGTLGSPTWPSSMTKESAQVVLVLGETPTSCFGSSDCSRCVASLHREHPALTLARDHCLRSTRRVLQHERAFVSMDGWFGDVIVGESGYDHD